MPTKTQRTPSYRKHKPSGQGVVRLSGRDIYLGRHGTKASREQYDRLVAEWLAHGRRLPDQSSDVTVAELIVAYWKHVTKYYRRPDGSPTSEVECTRQAMRPLKRLYSRASVAEFTPTAFKAVRQAMVDADWCRNVVNTHIGRVRRMFKWGVEHEMVPASVFQSIQAVAGLRRGRFEARETSPVTPVPDEHVDAIKPHVSRQVWAMIEVQQLTGMRPGEVATMRGQDLDTTGTLWLYRPASHKTLYRGHDRVVELGPRCQDAIRPFLNPDVSACLFSAADANAEFRAEKRRRRKSKVTPSQAARRPKRKPKKNPRDRYSPDSYRRCIAEACKKADVPHWHPHQLRHNYGTMIRREFGIETARILLGHRSVAMAELYSEIDRTKARAIVTQVG